MRLLFLLLLFVIFTCRLSSQISIIGPATPTGDWDTDHDLIQSSSSVWTGTFVLNAGELKFRQTMLGLIIGAPIPFPQVVELLMDQAFL